MNETNNPFLKERPPAPQIPFEPHERKLLGAAGRWIFLAGVANLTVGALTLLSQFVVTFSVVGVLRALAFVTVGVLTMLPSFFVAKIDGAPKRDVDDLAAAFVRLKILFAVKAGAAGVLILVAITLFRYVIWEGYGPPQGIGIEY